VTVVSSDEKSAQLRVDIPVTGALAEELTIKAKGFVKQDLAPGTQLLVFFNGKDTAPKPVTSHYELVIDGKIREYNKELYLEWTRYEAGKLPKVKPQAKPAVAEPATETGPVSVASPAEPNKS
jgi:hypothetical protein